MAKVTLPAEVAAKYDLVGWHGGHRQNFGKYGIIDLHTLTLKQADRLVEKGFTKLKLKPKAATSSADDKKK